MTSYRPGFSKTSKRWINLFTEMVQRCSANANKKDQQLDQLKKSTDETDHPNRSENKIKPEKSKSKTNINPEKSDQTKRPIQRESGLDRKDKHKIKRSKKKIIR